MSDNLDKRIISDIKDDFCDCFAKNVHSGAIPMSFAKDDAFLDMVKSFYFAGAESALKTAEKLGDSSPTDFLHRNN
tara:strand:+ start:361 stop:588 length:228 start_codon:yes stop_codon:yes gene_type:complete